MIQQPFSSDAMIQQIVPALSEVLKFSDRTAGVGCPACRQELSIAFLDSLKVAACQECKGILIECETLAATIVRERAKFRGPDDQPKPLDPRQLNLKRECPGCGDRFETHPYCGPGNSVIDSCADCRLIWLDRGELKAIIEAPGRRSN